jgi:hypothetical protein
MICPRTIRAMVNHETAPSAKNSCANWRPGVFAGNSASRTITMIT